MSAARTFASIVNFFQSTEWPLLLLGAFAGGALVWADANQKYPVAQGALIAFLLIATYILWRRFGHTCAPYMVSAEAQAYDRALHRLLIGLFLGVSAVVINATRYDRWTSVLVARGLAYGILNAGACFASGVLLGFLFGFRPAQTAQGDDDDKQPARSRRHPHTNLEEIADWLTKIIIGATLVQLEKLRELILRFATFMAKGIDPEANPAIALAIIGYFFCLGALYGYIWTRWEFALSPDTVEPGAPSRVDASQGDYPQIPPAGSEPLTQSELS